MTSALPDFQGRIWFVSKQNGKVGMLDPRTGKARVLRLGEEVENSFAVGPRRRLHRLRQAHVPLQRGPDGRPHIDWKVDYRNSGIHKPSQVDAGSGTTPTVMKGGYVAITDNADPMNVVVYRKATKLKHGQQAVVCQVPVFGKGASATENSLITAGRSLIVENNYGYQDPFGPNAGAITEPGFARVDLDRRGTGCRRVWTNTTERAPERGAEAVDQDRPDLHLHAGSRPGGRPALVVGGHHVRTGRPRGSSSPAPGAVQEQLRGHRARAERHGLPGRVRRDRRTARHALAGAFPFGMPWGG